MSYILEYTPRNPLEVTHAIFFYSSINRFVDEEGNIIYDLSNLFSTIQLDMWKKQKRSSYMLDRNGEVCALYYPDSETEKELCTHRCLWCPQNCEIRELWDAWEQEQLGLYEHSVYFDE